MFDTTPTFALGRFTLTLDRVHVMGILNCTPDSFSDGGQFNNVVDALAFARQMHTDGASMIDVGGESTRPGAIDVSLQAELDRVIPLIESIHRELDVAISIDTRKPEVMRAAVKAGAVLINDVNALQAEGALEAAGESGASVVLMHMQGQPKNMQQQPDYLDVVEEVARFLTDRIFACQLAGIDKKRIIVDPGFGFGKTNAHNLALLAQLRRFQQTECPVLVGLSRKNTIGELTGQKDPKERVFGSIAAHIVAAQRGANIIRTHDVRATMDALKVLQAVPREKVSPPNDTPDFSTLFGSMA
jgi:dihydropteroate synthase